MVSLQVLVRTFPSRWLLLSLEEITTLSLVLHLSALNIITGFSCCKVSEIRPEIWRFHVATCSPSPFYPLFCKVHCQILQSARLSQAPGDYAGMADYNNNGKTSIQIYQYEYINMRTKQIGCKDRWAPAVQEMIVNATQTSKLCQVGQKRTFLFQNETRAKKPLRLPLKTAKDSCQFFHTAKNRSWQEILLPEPTELLFMLRKRLRPKND